MASYHHVNFDASLRTVEIINDVRRSLITTTVIRLFIFYATIKLARNV